MAEHEQPKLSPSENGTPHASWRHLLLRPGPWVVISFISSQIVEKLFELGSPESIERIRRINESLIEGVAAVQPWYGVAIFWQKLTTHWPDNLSPIGIPFFLFGRAIGGGFEAILLPLSGGLETAVPAFIGYAMGLYLVWRICDALNREVDLLTGILGTLFIGGFCLMILQPLMLIATHLFGFLLGTVSGGIGVLASIPIPLGLEFAKHVAAGQAEARLEKAIEGKPAPPVTEAVLPDPPALEEPDVPPPAASVVDIDANAAPPATSVDPRPAGAASDPLPPAVGAAEKPPPPKIMKPMVVLWILSWLFSFGSMIFGFDHRHPLLVYGVFFFGFLMLYLCSRMENSGKGSPKAR